MKNPKNETEAEERINKFFTDKKGTFRIGEDDIYKSTKRRDRNGSHLHQRKQ